MHVFFKTFLFFHGYCSSLFVFQLSVRINKGSGLLGKKRMGVDSGREGVEN